MKNVFIRKDGQLEICNGGQGKLASIEEVLEYTSMTNKVIQGLIQLKDNVYSWFDNLDNKESVADVGEIAEYIVHNNVITLYTELVNDTDDLLEEIVNVCLDEGDTVLRALSKSKHNNTVYIYNYSRMDGKVDKNYCIGHVSMFTELFTA